MFPKTMLLSLIVLTGCDDAKYCTEIGCMNGFTLTFVGPSGEDVANVSGSISSNMMSTDSIAFDCSGEGSGEDYYCDGNSVTFFLEDMDTVFVTADSDPYMISTEVSLDWEEATPNGEDCPPVCYNASAEVSMEMASPPQ